MLRSDKWVPWIIHQSLYQNAIKYYSFDKLHRSSQAFFTQKRPHGKVLQVLFTIKRQRHLIPTRLLKQSPVRSLMIYTKFINQWFIYWYANENGENLFRKSELLNSN